MAKLSEEQFSNMTEIRQKASSLTFELGSLERTIHQVKKRKEEINALLNEKDSELEQFMQTVREEFGEGSIDVNTGEFTSAGTAE